MLPLDAGRPVALLQQAGVVYDQGRVVVAEVLDHIVPDVVEDLVGVPLDPVQQLMEPVRA
ncbi:hypothetical protein GCM10010243_34620 [Streptomyces matensis]|nr:hypothetical protein GCM10010243_34620 [Streptomyces matensis]